MEPHSFHLTRAWRCATSVAFLLDSLLQCLFPSAGPFWGGRSHRLYRNVSLQQPSCFSWAFPSLPHCLCLPPRSLGENQLSVLGWRELHILGVLSHPSMGPREVSRDLGLKFAVLGRSLPLLLVGSGPRSGIPRCLFFFFLCSSPLSLSFCLPLFVFASHIVLLYFTL